MPQIASSHGIPMIVNSHSEVSPMIASVEYQCAHDYLSVFCLFVCFCMTMTACLVFLDMTMIAPLVSPSVHDCLPRNSTDCLFGISQYVHDCISAVSVSHDCCLGSPSMPMIASLVFPSILLIAPSVYLDMSMIASLACLNMLTIKSPWRLAKCQ